MFAIEESQLRKILFFFDTVTSQTKYFNFKDLKLTIILLSLFNAIMQFPWDTTDTEPEAWRY
jgi:hypothetical protein